MKRAVSLSFDFNIDASSNREDFELIDGVEGWVEDVEEADVGADFELFP